MTSRIRLTPGSRVGPYEIVGLIGSGAMGEVFRARDPRIGRDVAIKVLPGIVERDEERLHRFEQEARAAGLLNHPHLLTIFDFGTHEESPYIVSELLEGETLRDQLERSAERHEVASSDLGLPLRKAVAFGRQICAGLAAAHERGMVHRDLKPENVFVTTQGRVKILDFGLAKLVSASEESDKTLLFQSQPGSVVGTPGYMAPEQVRGQEIDHRADIFAFGAIFYEMLTGQRAFDSASAVESMTKILRDDPPTIPQGVVPALILRILQHCLEKEPSDRYQSAKDLAFALEIALEGQPGSGEYLSPEAAPRPSALPLPVFRKVTFRRGFVMSARFAPDGTIIYGAAWEDNPLEILSARGGNPESRPLGLPESDILSISSAGEMAISLGRRFTHSFVSSGTLARVFLPGGAPREICEGVQDADFAPDGRSFAIVRMFNDKYRIEYPIDRVVYETSSWISDVRFSPDGKMLGFLEHAFWGDDAGRVMAVDLEGNVRLRSQEWPSLGGLAWHPGSGELWTAAELVKGRDLIAIGLSGSVRPVYTVPGRLMLYDISPKGEVLLAHASARRGMIAVDRNERTERNLSWFDWSFPTDLSADGSKLLFEEQIAEGNGIYSIHLRDTSGSPAVRLGEGRGRSLSPDGRWVLSVAQTSPQELTMLPTGAGASRVLRCENVDLFQAWSWFPDGERILIWGSEGGKALRLYVLDVSSGVARPISPEGVKTAGTISPDGSRVAAVSSDEGMVAYSTGGGEPRTLAGTESGETPLQWSEDGASLFVLEQGKGRAVIWKIDVERHGRELWTEIRPSDPAGVLDIGPVLLTRNGEQLVYGYRRMISDLYLSEGLR